jgi:trans-aconitate methyltransferase
MKFKFTDIVDVYDEHVNAHIPNYQKVIDKSVKLCKLYKCDASVLDFGSANGNTLRRLHNEGFTNLHGVETVQEMIDVSDKTIASYYHTLPNIRFDFILANWVLHFIEDKKSILEKFYNQLSKEGTLVISDKVSSNDIVKKFYYDFKTLNGVSNSDIKLKEDSLKEVMHLYSLGQYIEALNTVGFTTIEVIDGDWGFVTLMVKK